MTVNIQTFSIALMACIAIDKSILDINKILRSSVSSLLLVVAGDTTDADFDTNIFGGEIGIILKKKKKK